MANTRPSKTDMLAKRVLTDGAEAVKPIVAALAPLDRGGDPALHSATLDAWKMAVSRVRKAVAITLGNDHPTTKLLALPKSNRDATAAGWIRETTRAKRRPRHDARSIAKKGRAK